VHNAPVRRREKESREKRESGREGGIERKASSINAISVHNAPSTNKNASEYFNQL
jgi:hypothetical protein